MAVQDASFQTEQCATDLYQVDETSSGNPEEPGLLSASLPRQHAPDGTVQSGSQKKSGDDIRAIDSSGVQSM